MIPPLDDQGDINKQAPVIPPALKQTMGIFLTGEPDYPGVECGSGRSAAIPPWCDTERQQGWLAGRKQGKEPCAGNRLSAHGTPYQGAVVASVRKPLARPGWPSKMRIWRRFQRLRRLLAARNVGISCR